MKALQLKEYNQLFRDEAAYEEFVRLLSASLEKDELRVVFADGELVCTVMGPDAVRELMQYRIFRRFSDQPDLLDELRQRLGEEDLTD
jgi:hypothetical protein